MQYAVFNYTMILVTAALAIVGLAVADKDGNRMFGLKKKTA